MTDNAMRVLGGARGEWWCDYCQVWTPAGERCPTGTTEAMYGDNPPPRREKQ